MATATASKYDEIAAAVVRAIGGESNVASVTHCATRLRFQLKDREKADKDAVENTRGVITVVEAGGQFQVVIGNTVGNVYQSIVDNTSIPAGEGGASGGILARAIDLVTSIFTPFLWVLAGTGLLKALLAVVVEFSPDWATTPSYAILFAAADGVFQFLPVLLAITAAKRFKANPFTAVAIACALLYSATIAVIPGPDGATLTLQAYAGGGGELTFFGIPVVMIPYLSAVIPTILAVFAQAQLERVLYRAIPEALRNFLTPMITLLVIVPLTFLAIGPVSDLVGGWLSDGVNAVWDVAPAIGGLILGALWQVLVIFGLHWGLVPVMIQELTDQGYSLLTGPLFAAVLAQAAATFAVFLKTRNKELKEVAGPAAVSGFLAGITEPAIYGVTLRLKRPFVYGCIGGGIGGAIAAAGGSAAEGFVIPGLITLTATLNIGNFTLQLIGTGVAIAIAFGLTMVLGFKDLPASRPAAGADVDEGAVPSVAVPVAAPVAGRVVPLEAVPDRAFASGALGKGTGIYPNEGRVFSPANGTLVVAMPHAYGIRTDEGMEILVHVGLDTVELKGQHFAPKVAQGEPVTKGQLLAEFDIDAIIAAGYNPTVVMVVTNHTEYSAIVPMTGEGDVVPEELLLDVVN
jgi:PTS system beta-glucosides-specific IIC component